MLDNNYSQINSMHDNTELSMKSFLNKVRGIFFYLKSQWLVIISVGILGGSLGFFYAYVQKPVYRATLTFAMEDDKSSGSGLSGALGIASSFGIDLGSNAGGAFSGVNLIELMKSRRIVEKTLLSSIIVNGKELSLADYYLTFMNLRKGWNTNPKLSSISFFPNEDRSKYTLQKDSILGEIYESLVLKEMNISQRSTKVSIITIEINSKNELFSKFFAESLASVVSEFYVETKTRKSKANVSILQHQADSIRNELSGAINSVALANDNTFNLNLALNVERVPSLKKQVDVQANTAILTQLVTNLELAKVALRKETPLIQIIDKPILPLKKIKVGKLRSLMIGGFLGVLSVIFVIFFRRWWRNIIAE